jgi:hypothetical protein
MECLARFIPSASFEGNVEVGTEVNGVGCPEFIGLA